LPATSILINIFLTTKLSPQTWVRFAVWMGVGLLTYGLYGWKNSSGTRARSPKPSYLIVLRGWRMVKAMMPYVGALLENRWVLSLLGMIILEKIIYVS
jgi:hypothetical protein